MTDTLAPTAGAAPQTRAVVRFIEPGSMRRLRLLRAAGEVLGPGRVKQVICNVYVDGRWARVEHHHLDCYESSGRPHGDADDSQPLRSAASLRRRPPSDARQAAASTAMTEAAIARASPSSGRSTSSGARAPRRGRRCR